MKRYLSIFFGLTVIFLFAVALTTFADTQQKSILLPSSEVVNKDYFAAGDTVTIAGTVNGDAYVAGGNIIVEGVVNGDLLAAGGTITIRGTVTQDVRVVGGDVTVSGNVGRNITVAGGNISIPDSAKIDGSFVAGAGNVQIFAPLGKGITAGAGQLTIGNAVNGDVLAGVGMLTLTTKAKVNGDLHYWSDEKADVQSGASISGTISQTQPPKETKEAPRKVAGALTGFALAVRVVSFLSALIIGFFLIKYFPRFSLKTAAVIETEPWSALGGGFFTLFLTPILLTLLVVTLIGIPIAFVLFLVFLLLIYFSKFFVALAVGRKISAFTGIKTGLFGIFFMGLLLFEVIRFIPVLGGIVSFIALLLGLGALLIERKRSYGELRAKKLV